jgi:hypothetical protein
LKYKKFINKCNEKNNDLSLNLINKINIFSENLYDLDNTVIDLSENPYDLDNTVIDLSENLILN